jgi:predicted nucleotidyltransferase
MDISDSDSAVLDAVESSLCHDSDIDFVVLFGSQSSDNSRPSSDVDIAVKFADDLSSHERFRKQCFISGNLQQDDAPFIDISDIDALPIAVAHDAVNGTFLCGDERTFRQFKTDLESSFDEQHDDIRRKRRAIIDRIAEEGIRG